MGRSRREVTRQRARAVLTMALRVSALLCWLPAAALGAQDSTATSAGTPEALSLRFCGRSLGSGDGLVLGVLRSSSGSPRQGLQVAALWNEAEISRAGSRTLLRASVDTSTADGFFVLCGVPRETSLRLRAGSLNEGTGELSVSVPASGLLQRELVVGDVTLVATVSGRVVDADGRALPASITLEGDTLTAARSDSTGAFSLRGVPRRSGQVSIRAIGVLPLTLDLAPDGPLVELGDVVLSSVVQQMEEITVRERMLVQREREFEERRRSLAFGTFLDEATLRRQPLQSRLRWAQTASGNAFFGFAIAPFRAPPGMTRPKRSGSMSVILGLSASSCLVREPVGRKSLRPCAPNLSMSEARHERKRSLWRLAWRANPQSRGPNSKRESGDEAEKKPALHPPARSPPR